MESDYENLPIIDWELGLRLAGKNEGLAQDLLDLFIKQLPQDILLIKQLHTSNQRQALKQYLHKFHGGLSYIGLPRIKTLVCRLESALKTNIMISSSLIEQLEIEVNFLLEHYSHLQSLPGSAQGR